MIQEIKNSIENIYEEILFKDNFVDKVTGAVNGTNKKLATFPYIGSNYGMTKKILFVGFDMGEDEEPGEIQTFEMRKSNIEGSWNNHISGTYFTALYFLKEDLKAEKTWNEIVLNGSTFKQSFKAFHELKELQFSPISLISLSNFYKFVTNHRKGRSDNMDRKYINQEKEEMLFLKEIEVLNPEIVIFQSVDFNKGRFSNLVNELINSNRKVIIGPHPSHRGTKVPQEFINLLKEVS